MQTDHADWLGVGNQLTLEYLEGPCSWWSRAPHDYFWKESADLEGPGTDNEESSVNKHSCLFSVANIWILAVGTISASHVWDLRVHPEKLPA